MNQQSTLPTPPSVGIRLDGTDQFFWEVLEEADLPALLPALAQVTGDLRLVDQSIRPPTGVSTPAVPLPQGGMSAAAQTRARQLAFEALKKLRDSEELVPLDLTDDAQLLPLVTFISGDENTEALPLVHHELNTGKFEGSPNWSIQELAPHRATQFKALVIGAGPQGIQAAYRLNQAGIDVTVLEKNDEVGGTWYENKYPGCRLDTPNYTYSYSFLQKATWPQVFLEQKYLYDYFATAASSLDVRRFIQFNTEVEELRFTEKSSTWKVTARKSGQAQELEFDIVISAVGQLNRPAIPNFPGADSFEGRQWHTTDWPTEVELKGKRVAVIGTGATGFQVIPTIAPEVDHLSVFQRTPPWMYPEENYHAEMPQGMRWLFDNVPTFHRWYRFLQFYTNLEGRVRFLKYDPAWDHPVSTSEKNEELRQKLEEYILSEFADRPDLLPHVIPNYPPGAKRLLRDNGIWAKTLKSPHVDLVSEDIERIEPRGIVTSDGVLHEVDFIVYATGFKASDFLNPMTVIGRDGTDLHQKWEGDVKAYFGVNIPEFPNLFLLYGPNTNLVVNGSLILLQEMGLEFIISQLEHLLSTDSRSIEINDAPFDEYNDWVDRGNASMAWGDPQVNSWYRSTKSNRSSQNWPYTMLDYWKGTKGWKKSIFTLR